MGNFVFADVLLDIHTYGNQDAILYSCSQYHSTNFYGNFYWVVPEMVSKKDSKGRKIVLCYLTVRS